MKARPKVVALAEAMAMFEMQTAKDREDRFRAALTDEMRGYVEETEKLLSEFYRSVQATLTETDGTLRIEASTWVQDHAVDVGERNRVCMRMRIAFAERNP